MSASPFDLTGRVALVTGSSMGIGLGMATGLAKAGATVAINGRDAAKVKAAVAQLAAQKLKAVECVFDATDEASVDRGVSALEKAVGPVDILFNNAGMNIRGPLAEYSLADFRTTMSLNVEGILVVSQRVVKGMIERKRGKIVNTTSLSADATRAGSGVYATSKAAARMLTRAMAVEWAPHNIQVNAISPGWNLTDMMKGVVKTNPALDEFVKTRTPLGRWSDPGFDQQGAAVFLASSASDFITGQTVTIDGGFSITF